MQTCRGVPEPLSNSLKGLKMMMMELMAIAMRWPSGRTDVGELNILAQGVIRTLLIINKGWPCCCGVWRENSLSSGCSGDNKLRLILYL